MHPGRRAPHPQDLGALRARRLFEHGEVASRLRVRGRHHGRWRCRLHEREAAVSKTVRAVVQIRRWPFRSQGSPCVRARRCASRADRAPGRRPIARRKDGSFHAGAVAMWMRMRVVVVDRAWLVVMRARRVRIVDVDANVERLARRALSQVLAVGVRTHARVEGDVKIR
jgi:hypothetical protein